MCASACAVYLWVNLTNEQAMCGKSETAAAELGKNSHLSHFIYYHVIAHTHASLSVCVRVCARAFPILHHSPFYLFHIVYAAWLIDFHVYSIGAHLRAFSAHTQQYLYTFVWYNSIESMHLTCRAYFSSMRMGYLWNIRDLIPRILGCDVQAHLRMQNICRFVDERINKTE